MLEFVADAVLGVLTKTTEVRRCGQCRGCLWLIGCAQLHPVSQDGIVVRVHHVYVCEDWLGVQSRCSTEVLGGHVYHRRSGHWHSWREQHLVLSCGRATEHLVCRSAAPKDH